MTVGELKRLLATMFPDDATVHVVEGSDTGISIRDPEGTPLGFIYTTPA